MYLENQHQEAWENCLDYSHLIDAALQFCSYEKNALKDPNLVAYLEFCVNFSPQLNIPKTKVGLAKAK